MSFQVFALICDAENPQVFTVEFIRGQIRKFSSTERFIDLTYQFFPYGPLGVYLMAYGCISSSPSFTSFIFVICAGTPF